MATVVLTPIGYTSGNYAYSDVFSDVSKTTASYLTPKILAQYSVDSTLLDKIIKKVTLSYMYYCPNPSIIYVTDASVKPAVFDIDKLPYITYENYSGYVTVGEGFTYSEQYTPQNGMTFDRDITSIFANNVNDNKFSTEIDVNYYANWTSSTPMESRFLYIYTPPTILVEYEEIVPQVPILCEPVEQYVNQGDAVTFRWIYKTDSSLLQASVTIEWRKQGDTSYNVVTVTQSSESYTFPAGTFPAGTIEYRLKTTDTCGNSSDYTYAKFVVKSPPAAPIITSINNCSLTRIEWNSSEQVAYEMALYKGDELIYDEKVNSSNKTYKPSFFLSDGNYTFKIRVKNSFDLWSDYAYKMFTISTSKPSKPTIKAFVDHDTVTLTITSVATENYIYRITGGKEQCIGRIQSKTGSIVDKSPVLNKLSEYFVRAYSTGYTDSDKVIARPCGNGFILSDSCNSINITKSLDKFMPFNESQSRSRQFINYLGRKYPVRELSEFINYSITRTCFVTQEELEILLEFEQSDDVVLYRDDRGRKVYCDLSLGSIKNEMIDTGYEVEVKITKVDYDEGVAIND